MATKSAPTPELTRRQQQLVLAVERPSVSWKIDEETREIGRRGLAQARAVLEATRSTHLDLAA